jgi:DNA (cytosine-5)-methyltransferase 1
MTRPRLLDLFCGAGGAAMGYHRAGFEVVGVDIKPQPHYPFEFHQADALTWPLDGFDAIHASPPCQAHTTLRVMHNARKHPDLLPPTRARLRAAGVPYVIENVRGAPMPNAVMLCGTVFGLGVKGYDRELRRHRLFETNFPLLVPPCHHAKATIGIYGDHARDRRRTRGGESGVDFPRREQLALGREALGMPWATWKELSQAIPPAYTEFIGNLLRQHLASAVAS